MDVLLSIKPKYVEEIINGNKRYEFRKIVFKQKPDKIVIYSSSPVKKIVGSFTPGEILVDTPKNIWKICRDYAGITEDDFFNYFAGKTEAYAIEIEDINLLDEPIDPREQQPGFTAPQSFCYTELSI
jgi:predicted transcriptional regulator